MNFILMHETVTSHDAIGVDIENMYRILNRKHTCRVYATKRINRKVKYIDDSELKGYLSDENTIVIYHHSVFWETGYDKVKTAKCKVIFRYHNITPEYFFEPYNSLHFNKCKRGIEQTVEIQRENPLAFWLSDSVRNRKDLTYVDDSHVVICPPFNNTEVWSKEVPDEKILKELIETDTLNILFVGRIAPNKGHRILLDVIRTYTIIYDKNIKLRIIGKFDDSLKIYNEELGDTIIDYGLKKNVEFIGEINDSKLMAYYLGSDVFLCCSEHEGFCVPIIEAQYFGLPIVAKNEDAVDETIGENQLVFDDVRTIVAGLRKIKNDEKMRDFLINCGISNFDDRFSLKVTDETFSEGIEKITGVKV